MKKKIVSIALIILSLLTVICFATDNLKEEVSDYVIPEEYRRNNDIMPVSENGEIEYLEGDQLIGEDESTTISNKNIEGNVFVIVTPNLTIENTIINGNLFVMANNISLKNVTVTGSAFIITQELKTYETQISDIYAFASKASIEGVISREMKILGETIEINCEVGGKTFISATDVKIVENTVLLKDAIINYSDNFIQEEGATCNYLNTTKVEVNDEILVEDKEEKIKKEIISWIVELMKTLLIVGFIIVCTDRKFEKFSENLTTKNKVILTLKGFAWLLLIPIATIVLILITGGYFIGFPIVALILYFVIAYLSLQIVSITIGSKLKNKLLNKGNIEYLGISAIVTTIIWLLIKLPVIGLLIQFIVICLSLGITMKYLFNNKERNNEDIAPVVELKEDK